MGILKGGAGIRNYNERGGDVHDGKEYIRNMAESEMGLRGGER